MAGARNVLFFHTKCVAEAGKVSSVNGRLRDDPFGFGSCPDHGRIILESNDASSVFSTFASYFGMSFFVAGAVFGDVGR